VEFVVNLCHSKGIKVILNPAPACELPDGLLEKVYILTPNETELGFLSKMSVGDLEEIKMAGKYLVGKGVQNVITTMGEKGSLFVNKHMEKLFEAINVNAVDTTAAGDSFTGALALALSRGESIEDAIRFATFVAALTVTKEGAQSSLPYKEEVEKFIMERS
jgi:ribokinase